MLGYSIHRIRSSWYLLVVQPTGRTPLPGIHIVGTQWWYVATIQNVYKDGQFNVDLNKREGVRRTKVGSALRSVSTMVCSLISRTL